MVWKCLVHAVLSVPCTYGPLQVYQFPVKHPCAHVFEAQKHNTSAYAPQPKETASNVEGDGDSEGESDDEAIPPYLPPLPKKEMTEDGELLAPMLPCWAVYDSLFAAGTLHKG